MPLFYFHVRNGLGFTRDEEGKVLPDVEAAREVALRGARSLIAAEVAEGRLDLRGAIEVEDEQGRPVLDLPFAEAVRTVSGELPSS
jgi:hypothetical protein